jgi:hypothetical protein
MGKTPRINRGENTPESLGEMMRALRALSAAVGRAKQKLNAKRQPVVKAAGTVGAWKSIAQLQRYAAQLKADIGNLPPGPPS